MNTRTLIAIFCTALPTIAATPAHASLFSLQAAGTITANSSAAATIPIGTPWSFEITYDTAAPDQDFLSTGSPDPTFGHFTNAANPPALTRFHYKAGTYEVTLDQPSAFAPNSAMIITFTTVHALDINIFAPTFFPTLAGGAVAFHADFNAFNAAPIFTSDALPTNTTLSATSFDQSTVTLLPHAGAISGNVTTLNITPIPEPATAAIAIATLGTLLTRRPRRGRPCRHSASS